MNWQNLISDPPKSVCWQGTRISAEIDYFHCHFSRGGKLSRTLHFHWLNISHFWVKKLIKNVVQFIAIFHHFFDLKSKWKMWNKFCEVVKMFLLHFLTELKVKMKVKKSKVFSLIFSPEIKVKNVKQSWSYCWDVCFTFLTETLGEKCETSLVEHFKFLSKKMDKNVIQFIGIFSLQKEVKILKHFSPLVWVEIKVKNVKQTSCFSSN